MRAAVAEGAPPSQLAPVSQPYGRLFNFAAGPAVLPVAVLEQAQADLLNYKGSGMSVMEMSHRSKVFDGIIKQAERDLRTLLAIPDNYKVTRFSCMGVRVFLVVCEGPWQPRLRMRGVCRKRALLLRCLSCGVLLPLFPHVRACVCWGGGMWFLSWTAIHNLGARIKYLRLSVCSKAGGARDVAFKFLLKVEPKKNGF